MSNEKLTDLEHRLGSGRVPLPFHTGRIPWVSSVLSISRSS